MFEDHSMDTSLLMDSSVQHVMVYKCYACDYASASEASLKRHITRTHPKSRHCSMCDFFAHDIRQLREHMRNNHKDEKALHCHDCDYIGLSTKALSVHRFRNHRAEWPCKQKCREIVNGGPCQAVFRTMACLRLHLAEHHGLAAALDTVREKFDTLDDFKRWKTEFELETGAVYNCLQPNFERLVYYRCSRSGVYTPTGRGQRRLKAQGSCKLGFTCTSVMTARRGADASVEVTVYPFHYGHGTGERERCHLRLPRTAAAAAAGTLSNAPSNKSTIFAKPKLHRDQLLPDDLVDLVLPAGLESAGWRTDVSGAPVPSDGDSGTAARTGSGPDPERLRPVAGRAAAAAPVRRRRRRVVVARPLGGGGRPTPPPGPRLGSAWRYTRLLRAQRTVRALEAELRAQREQLQRARLAVEGGDEAPGAAGPDGRAGTPLGADPAASLTVLRAADAEHEPSSFAEMDLLTAPTDLEAATRALFDLKQEVLTLRARLVRRAISRAALQMEVLRSRLRHERTESFLRAELVRAMVERAGGGAASRPGPRQGPARGEQQPDRPAEAAWGAADFQRAIALRQLCSQEAFDHVRTVLGVRLPSMEAVRTAALLGEFPEVTRGFEALDCEGVGDAGQARLTPPPAETAALEPDVPDVAEDVLLDPGAEGGFHTAEQATVHVQAAPFVALDDPAVARLELLPAVFDAGAARPTRPVTGRTEACGSVSGAEAEDQSEDDPDRSADDSDEISSEPEPPPSVYSESEVLPWAGGPAEPRRLRRPLDGVAWPPDRRGVW